MTGREMFVTKLEELLVNEDIKSMFSAEAIAYFELLKQEKPKQEKPMFTDNGIRILEAMRTGQDDKLNMFKANDIAELAFISVRSVSGGIRKLVNDGFVEIVSKEPNIYSLTESGKQISIEK